jgi:hypothetical protein
MESIRSFMLPMLSNPHLYSAVMVVRHGSQNGNTFIGKAEKSCSWQRLRSEASLARAESPLISFPPAVR